MFFYIAFVVGLVAPMWAFVVFAIPFFVPFFIRVTFRAMKACLEEPGAPRNVLEPLLSKADVSEATRLHTPATAVEQEPDAVSLRWVHLAVWFVSVVPQVSYGAAVVLVAVLMPECAVGRSGSCSVLEVLRDIAWMATFTSGPAAAYYWLRLKRSREADADLLALAAWLVALLLAASATWASLLLLDPVEWRGEGLTVVTDVVVPEVAVPGISFAVAIIALAIAASLRRTKFGVLALAVAAWLAIQAVVWVWLRFDITLTHAVWSVLSFGVAATILFGRTGAVSDMDRPQARAWSWQLLAIVSVVLLLVAISVWRHWGGGLPPADQGVFSLGIPRVTQLLIPGLVGAFGLVFAAVVPVLYRFAPILLALTWSALWVLPMNDAGRAVDDFNDPIDISVWIVATIMTFGVGMAIISSRKGRGWDGSRKRVV